MPSIQSKPPSGIALTEAKVMRCVRYIRTRDNDTKQVSWQLSRFYFSHVWFLGSFFHSSSSLTAFRMPYATEVILFLVADKADDRLVAETVRFPSFDSRNPPRARTDCQCACMYDLSSSASKSTATWRMLFTRIRKPSLQAKRTSISSMRTVETQNR